VACHFSLESNLVMGSAGRPRFVAGENLDKITLDSGLRSTDIEPRDYMKSNNWKWTITILILIIGAWLSLESFNQLRAQSRIHNRPTAEGVVIYSGVDNDQSNMPLIVYRYAIKGAEYIDTTGMGAPGFGGKRKRWEYARDILARFPDSTKVPVHYNPADPKDSAIRTSVNFEVYTQLSFGICLLLGALGWMVALFRAR
jgi:Protein of unknown function (DUF3592)